MSRLTEQIRMMEEMLYLQSNIRTKKEKERAVKALRTEKYTSMLEPVTKSLERLKPQPVPISAAVRPTTSEIKEEKNLGDFSLPATAADVKAEHDEEDDDENSGIYHAVLNSIHDNQLDDGVFGLNVDDHSIGDYNYRVRNDILEVYASDRILRYPIKDNINLWKLLLAKTPNGIQLRIRMGGKYMKFVEDYMKIVDELDLVNAAFQNYDASSVTKRAKYKLIKNMEKKGSGFMFSVRPPPFAAAAAAGKHRIKPSTIVIPSDKKGLLRELVKAVAELRAGNKSMRNLVVPLAQEAKRKKILPRHLLSADEKTWVFA